jgi:ABC-type multidrug transport system fused ATPase/permease subunit
LNRKNKLVNGKRKVSNISEGIEVEFRDVWFKYPKTDTWVLKNLNFKISTDEDLAVVGKNGAGKTTLIKLILRIYDVDKGEILINGVNIKEYDLHDYYKYVGILTQFFARLGVTAEENIYIGNVLSTKDRGRIIDSAKKADIHDAIKKWPKQYATYNSRIIKNGIIPSGGQWQKIAVARAFYRDAKLLILDEPTSAVDALSEEKIFDNIRENAKNKTTLIVSHRFATVRKAKRIVVIDNGKIVEDGDHSTLMKLDGLYANMYRTQVEKV